MEKINNQPQEGFLARLSRALKSGFDFVLFRLDEYRSQRERARCERTRLETEKLDAAARRLRADTEMRDAETRARVAETGAWEHALPIEAEADRVRIEAEARAEAELLREAAEQKCQDRRERARIRKEKWNARLDWLHDFATFVWGQVGIANYRKSQQITAARQAGVNINHNPFLAFAALSIGGGLLAISLIFASGAAANPAGSYGDWSLTCFALCLLSAFASWRLRKQPFGKAMRQTFFNPVTIPAALVGLGLILRLWR